MPLDAPVMNTKGRASGLVLAVIMGALVMWERN
jgi:hypothetical protein